MTGRHIVVVDCETSALEPNSQCEKGLFGQPVGIYGVATEIAWWDLTTGEHGCFIPQHDVQRVRSHGAIQALTVSRYLERLATAEQDRDGTAVRDLHPRLLGNTMAGSNPGFDARFLRPVFANWRGTKDNPEPWHHRLLDVSAYAAGKLALPGNELPGLAKVCELLDVEPPDHTAMGDVRATGECLYKLGAAQRPEGDTAINGPDGRSDGA